MFFNQQMPYGGLGYPMYTGTGAQYMGVGPQNVPQMKNHLTQEEIQKLMQKENSFSLVVTETEKLRATCNHRLYAPDATGKTDAITEDPVTGACRCAICGYEFRPIDTTTSVDTLKDSVADVLDILQTIKLIYVDMPDDVAREFYVIIPLMEKIPQLFERAVKNYVKYDNQNPYGFNNRNMNAVQLFNMMSGYLTGQVMPQMQQNPYQQPTMPNAMPGMNPYQQPMMGMMGSNGFVQQPGYMPNTMGYAYNPQQAQAAPQAQANPAVPVATAATTDGKNVTVDSTFKA